MAAIIRNPEAFEQAIDEKLNEIALDIFKKSQENLDHLEVNYTGQLKKSAQFDLSQKFKKTITYNTTYAQAIEFGSDPHPVPFAAIKKWARLKLGKDEQFAWAVTQKIRTKGTVGYFFLSASMTWAKEQYRK